MIEKIIWKKEEIVEEKGEEHILLKGGKNRIHNDKKCKKNNRRKRTDEKNEEHINKAGIKNGKRTNVRKGSELGGKRKEGDKGRKAVPIWLHSKSPGMLYIAWR